jgi:hypothetical protein
VNRYTRLRRTTDSRPTTAVEFADLLDPIYVAKLFHPSADPEMAYADRLVADMIVATRADLVLLPEAAVPDPVLEVEPEPLAVVIPISRFADAGVDDDRLPLHVTAKRFRLR